MNAKRLFVEKKIEFRTSELKEDLCKNLGLEHLENVRRVIRYDINDFPEDLSLLVPILSEPNIDDCTETTFELKGDFILSVRPLEGQYDVRSAFASECIRLAYPDFSPQVKSATIYLFSGTFTEKEITNLQKYFVNPVESILCEGNEGIQFNTVTDLPTQVETMTGFISFSPDELETLRQNQGFAMTFADLNMIQDYFKKENREPTITELKVIDTYWSDHCRHTTFMTELTDVELPDSDLQKAYEDYLTTRQELGVKKPICMMDMATLCAKYLKSKGKLKDLDESEEINACSINVRVNNEKWLLMFKNETHNHPTEIEPFGGAATCLGGAIRDPLSGRSYVFGAMRVTGSADPRTPFQDTMEGKLPQKTITQKAAHGYSSYGNQIGLTTGGVFEMYHPNYVAKRLEVGAVLGACPKINVVRKRPVAGDVILLLGGRTGRDGIGGATGSSKVHTTQSTEKSASEVQKGNPVEERKIQRLFRNLDATKLIKKCNDFGAGGVCVAIGELADSLVINLDKIPKKYQGLDGTELAISESQERMAVVLDPKDVAKFTNLAQKENIEVVKVAEVTKTGFLVMRWNGKNIFKVKRKFLDTNGAKAQTKVKTASPVLDFFRMNQSCNKENLLKTLGSLNCCSQKGLSEQFDSSIGSNTVLSPFGGKNRLTPPDGLAIKFPLLQGETTETALMTYGCSPELGIDSPFHGGIYSVVEALSKLSAIGGNPAKARLSNQEYFERMVNPEAFGKPVAALLGVFQAQKELEVPSIGGKDSMSGTFGDINVPPTMITFAVTTESAEHIISPELKEIGTELWLIPVKTDEKFIPDYVDLKEKYRCIYEEIGKENIISAKTVTYGGAGVTAISMMLGNDISVSFAENAPLLSQNWGGIVVEVKDSSVFAQLGVLLGKTVSGDEITLPNCEKVSISECHKAYEETLESVFPSKTSDHGQAETITFSGKSNVKPSTSVAKPRVFIPVFPGTNCEYDTARAFVKAGANCKTLVFKNANPNQIKQTIDAYVKAISESQIVMLPGGFSASDEPDGSAKFIATVLRNPTIAEEIMNLLQKRDGLMLGICNGFQALVKLGLLPYGEISPLKEGMPTLTYNKIARHVSCMSDTRISSDLSPWLSHCKVGEIHTVAMSHGEGRFVANEDMVKTLISNGQIATQYVNPQGEATLESPYNPNGSTLAIEGITSPDGRILGKMGHSERSGEHLYQNISGNLYQPIFQGGVDYFK